MNPQTRVVVVAGLSGAGKSTAIAALEDLGYHAVENLPPSVIEHAIKACELAGIFDIALGFAADVGAFLEGAAEEVARLASDKSRQFSVVFLDASDEVLLRRFSETRRPHPLSSQAGRGRSESMPAPAVIDGVSLERERLASLRSLASVVLDTSGMRVHDLRKRILRTFRTGVEEGLRMQVRVQSFGFKFGLPNDADTVFDVRFLDNPFFVPELRELTGQDAAVSDYVLGTNGAAEFLRRAVEFLLFLLPRYEAEGKSYLTIGIGCTGGQHRSVALSRALGAELVQGGYPVSVVHRDAAANRGHPPPEDTPAPPTRLGASGGARRGGVREGEGSRG